MADSVFTRIIRRELPAEIMYENDDFIVILSIQPHTPGHSLVIPKKQSTGNFWDLPPQELSALVLIAQKIAKVLYDELQPQRVGLVFEGFGVRDHVHVNLIPINGPDDLDHTKAHAVSTEELTTMGERLRKAVRQAGL